MARHGIHWVLAGQDRTLCGNPTAILLASLRGECSVCREARQAIEAGE